MSPVHQQHIPNFFKSGALFIEDQLSNVPKSVGNIGYSCVHRTEKLILHTIFVEVLGVQVPISTFIVRMGREAVQ